MLRKVPKTGIVSSVLHRVSRNCGCVKSRKKVSIIGTGAVGMAVAYAIMIKELVNEIALIDRTEDKVRGEVMDMEQCQQFLNNCKIKGGSDYSLSENSDVIIITAGARQEIGESRLNLVQRNVEIYKGIIPEIVKRSPAAILLVVSNPDLDIMTYVTWKISGFPRHRVMGSGTCLDSSRFRWFIAQRFGIDPESVDAMILGEHGDSSVAVWSKVTIGGCILSSFNEQIGTDRDVEKFAKIHKATVNSAYKIIKAKGYTAWSIGVCCWQISNLIINNKKSILPVTTCVKGQYGIKTEAFMSLPCVIGSCGIKESVNFELSTKEIEALRASAKVLTEITDAIIW